MAPGNLYNKMEEGQLIQLNHFFLGKKGYIKILLEVCL